MMELSGSVHVLFTLVVATALGGLLGAERESLGKPAGLRTHMMVSLGAAVFTLGPLQAGLPMTEASRVIQGIAAGVGFIGAGTILKNVKDGEIQGLTTAASLWLAAAGGVSVGLGEIVVPVIASLLALAVLGIAGIFQRRAAAARPPATVRRNPFPSAVHEVDSGQ
jgi:putative Mg2+ transporter-C (MgtC) family protein